MYPSTFTDIMPVFGNMGVLGQSDRGKVSRSKTTT